MSALTLYLLTILPGFGGLGVIIIVLSTASLITMTIVFFENDQLVPKSWIVPAVSCLALGVSLALLVPSKEDIAIILAGSYLTNLEGVSEVPENIISSLNNYIESKGIGECVITDQ